MLKALFSRAPRALFATLGLTLVASLVLGTGYAVAGGTKGTGNCKRSGTCTTTDTTAPSVSIGAPTSGATVGGTISIAGTASDNVSVAGVSVSVDGGAYSSASGTTSWSTSLNTAAYPDGSHTISARATDSSGNTKVVSETVTFSNTVAPSPSPTPTTSSSPSPTTSPSPSPSPTSGSAGCQVDPYGVTICINSAGGWTYSQIESMLVANALELSVVGPHLTIQVQDTYSDSTATSASTSGGVYVSYKAVTYLKGVNDTFVNQPDATLAHEYGHVWTLYHLYMTHNGSWSSYLNTRWANSDGSLLLGADPNLDTSYSWMKTEIIADDYRLLFSSPTALAQRTVSLNTQIPDPRNQPGLKDWFLNTWE